MSLLSLPIPQEAPSGEEIPEPVKKHGANLIVDESRLSAKPHIMEHQKDIQKRQKAETVLVYDGPKEAERRKESEL